MTNGAKLRVGVVGLGRAGRIHLDAWRAVPGVRVVAVCDPAPAVVHAARAEGLHAVADPSELFATVPLDAVSIAAPPAQHKGGVYDKHASHVAMMRAFLDVLSGTRRPWITPGECLRTGRGGEASYHSLRSGAWVPVHTMGVCETQASLSALG